MRLSLPRAFAFVILAGVSMAIGYVAGRVRTEPESKTTDSASVEQLTMSMVRVNSSSTSTVQESDEIIGPRFLINRIDELSGNDRFGIRRYQYKVLIDSMTAEEAPLLLAELRDDYARKDRDILMHFLFQRWGEVDGAAATMAARGLPGRERATLTGSAFAGWAKSDPEQAWDTSVTLAKDWPAFASQARRVITQLVRQDLMGAIARRNDLGTQRGNYAIQNAIISYAAEEGRLDTVLAAALEFDDIEVQKRWITNIYSSWGQTESDDPLAALGGIGNPALAQSAMTGFLNGWAVVDPMGAVEYTLANREDPMVAGSLGRVVQQALMSGNRKRTLELVEQVAAIGELDNLAPTMMPRVASTNPQIALQMAEMLSDSKEQRRYKTMAMRAWARNDFDAAAAHFEQMPHNATKIQTLGSLAYSTLSREDGGTAVSRWVQSMSAGEDRIKAVETLLQSAQSRNINLSRGSLEVLQDLARNTPGLPEAAQESAQGLSEGERSPATPGFIFMP